MSSSLSLRAVLATSFLMLLFAGAYFAQAQSGDPFITLVVIDQDGNSNESAEIIEGDQITLAWFGENVQNCKINPGDITAEDTGSSSTYFDGQIVVTPDEDSTEYRIACQGVRDSVDVFQTPVVTMDVDYDGVDLRADGSLLPGNPTISWTTKNVTYCSQVQRRIPGSGYFYDLSPVNLNSSGQWVESEINKTGMYEYQFTCIGLNGRPVSVGTSVEVQGIPQLSTLSMTASPKNITADTNGQGTVEVSWTGENLSWCAAYLHHHSPTIDYKDSQLTYDNTSGTRTFTLKEPGEHRFGLGCSRGDNNEAIYQTTTATLSYTDVPLNVAKLSLTADPSAITLTATGSVQRTRLSWSGAVVSRCSKYLQRKAPSESQYRDIGRVYETSGFLYDYGISETGTYTYKLTCYASVDGRAITATENVNVEGESLALPKVSVVANPNIVAPDPSTGLASTTLTWSYANVNPDTCSWLDKQSPSRRAADADNFSPLDNAPPRVAAGTSVHDDIDEYGTWKYRLRCKHPVTGENVTSIEEVEVIATTLLPANMSLSASVVDDKIKVAYSSENYSTCHDYIERRAPGSSNWTDFTHVLANSSGTVEDSPGPVNGIYSYRMTCDRPIEGRSDTSEAQVTYLSPLVTGMVSVGFSQCRNAVGNPVSIPDGYTADASGNCILDGILGDINLSFTSALIRAGDNAEITWEYSGTYVFDVCSLQGPGIIDPNTGDTTTNLLVNVSPGFAGIAQTDPRYATSLYSMTCTNSYMTAPLISETIRLNIVPPYQEV